MISGQHLQLNVTSYNVKGSSNEDILWFGYNSKNMLKNDTREDMSIYIVLPVKRAVVKSTWQYWCVDILSMQYTFPCG